MTPVDLTPGTALPELRIDPVSRKTLALFAGASGDHQPSHIDIDAARAKGRDDVIVHGMFVMACLGRVLTDVVPQARICRLSTRFVAVTPVYGAPVCTGRVTAVQDGLATIALEAHLADGKLVARGEATVAVD